MYCPMLQSSIIQYYPLLLFVLPTRLCLLVGVGIMKMDMDETRGAKLKVTYMMSQESGCIIGTCHTVSDFVSPP